MGMNLPSTRSIRRWLENINIRPGINENLLTVVQDSVKSMCEREKDAIMMMDEMAIKQLLQYDKPSDSIDGVMDHGNGKRRLEAANHVNVILVRGLNSNWVFPIAYYFTEGNTTSVEFKYMLDECLVACYKIGINIRVFVCDQGFTNQGLYKMLGVGVQ
jgi:hypothetical protein